MSVCLFAQLSICWPSEDNLTSDIEQEILNAVLKRKYQNHISKIALWHIFVHII